MDDARLLAAYDSQLRAEAEMRGTVRFERHGPLFWGMHHGGRGFVSYRSLGAPTDAEVEQLITDTVEHYAVHPEVTEFEWKTRGHDGVPQLHGLLVRHGFVAEDVESVMVGEAVGLAADLPLPEGVALRRVTELADVTAMAAMQASVFGDPETIGERVEATMHQLEVPDPGFELWVAESEGRVISAGRVNPVPGTDFAGIWGGATLPEWRGRGIYRALTAKRAQAALQAGKKFINSDSTEYSRPILERYGFRRVTTTTPYIWRR
ncbi:GNAT family N-acetyltransferase [Flexivirga caeni]|uniref:GNAT family N-acetyltransferase n=1 Tax=Flexivirga caeni TaxID=2294115 RepID=A0A3M9LYE6_9MICO|nr:GNAT family N-acetyltransferase [Flexivirga caeni]RNI18314.1 GNAT family N-acetyltransferase [Flexivirga caeni]